jgi:bifunctional polynucleotide phosphatase/kinase
VPLAAFAALSHNQFRKPKKGMWDHFVNKYRVDVSKLHDCFYIGDAAGRAAGWKFDKRKDHSCVDRKFALNANLKFMTPEEYFERDKEAPFSLGFDPRDYLEKSKNMPLFAPTSTPLFPPDANQEMVIFVGFPASGKTSFARKHLIPRGYVHVNQDELGTRKKCMTVTNDAILGGSSVIIGVIVRHLDLTFL